MQRRPDVYIELALNALRRVPRYIGQRSEADYLNDDYCQSAVERQLEIAGDASSKARGAATRRVLHFVFGPPVLPFGLTWLDSV
jgi:uncharacterized protein with HEPN domain